MSRRGPRRHRLTRPDGLVAYQSSGPWVCACGAEGADVPSGREHLRVKAKAAFKRLSDVEAWVNVSVSGGDPDQRAAMLLLQVNRSWYGSPLLRKHMIPYYSWTGSLSARLDWPALAAGLGDGSIAAADPHDDLVLRLAVAIAGLAVPIRLTDLRRLDEQEASAVDNVLGRWLHRADE